MEVDMDSATAILMEREMLRISDSLRGINCKHVAALYSWKSFGRTPNFIVRVYVT